MTITVRTLTAADAPALGDFLAAAHDHPPTAEPFHPHPLTAEYAADLGGRLAGLKKDDLVAISEKIGMAGMKAKTKDKIQEAIRDRILARKGAGQRAALIDRATDGGGPPAPGQ